MMINSAAPRIRKNTNSKAAALLPVLLAASLVASAAAATATAAKHHTKDAGGSLERGTADADGSLAGGLARLELDVDDVLAQHGFFEEEVKGGHGRLLRKDVTYAHTNVAVCTDEIETVKIDGPSEKQKPTDTYRVRWAETQRGQRKLQWANSNNVDSREDKYYAIPCAACEKKQLKSLAQVGPPLVKEDDTGTYYSPEYRALLYVDVELAENFQYSLLRDCNGEDYFFEKSVKYSCKHKYSSSEKPKYGVCQQINHNSQDNNARYDFVKIVKDGDNELRELSTLSYMEIRQRVADISDEILNRVQKTFVQMFLTKRCVCFIYPEMQPTDTITKYDVESDISLDFWKKHSPNARKP